MDKYEYIHANNGDYCRYKIDPVTGIAADYGERFNTVKLKWNYRDITRKHKRTGEYRVISERTFELYYLKRKEWLMKVKKILM